VSSSTPFGESVGSPRDLGGDRTYEDINGLLPLEEPALLEFYIDSKAVKKNAEAFDFNDVIILKAIAREKKTC